MQTAIGIDIGGTNTKMVIASDEGRILASLQSPTPKGNDQEDESIAQFFIRTLKIFLGDEATQSRLAEAGSPVMAGIGIGIAGLIDRKHGKVLESPNLTAVNGLPLQEIFEKEFSLPVVLENDANIYAFGEKWIGAGRDFDNFIVLTLGTGLGGGLIYKGELYEGPVEVGHMAIVPNGRYCTCGSYGCLESYASGRALVDRVISSLEKGPEKSMLSKCCDGNFYKMTPEVIYETALEGDNLSREVFREMGQFLGIGVANLINILSLDAVIIGGGLIGSWELFIEELTHEVNKRAFETLVSNVKIIKSALTKDAGSIGAAGLLLKKISGAHSVRPVV